MPRQFRRRLPLRLRWSPIRYLPPFPLIFLCGTDRGGGGFHGDLSPCFILTVYSCFLT
jgi:hypothetical protein